jgi:hypothetical protein
MEFKWLIAKMPTGLPGQSIKNWIVFMGLARVERAAYRLGGNRSIHLSYSPNGFRL